MDGYEISLFRVSTWRTWRSQGEDFLHREPGFSISSQFWANVREKIRKSGRGSFMTYFFCDCMNHVLILIKVASLHCSQGNLVLLSVNSFSSFSFNSEILTSQLRNLQSGQSIDLAGLTSADRKPKL